MSNKPLLLGTLLLLLHGSLAAAADQPDQRLVAAQHLAAVVPDLVKQPDMIGLALAVVVDDQVVVLSQLGSA